MLTEFRRDVAQALASGGYLVLLYIGGQLKTPSAWRIVATLIAALALLAWQMSLRRALAIADTPTSKISSAAQGYVELLGRGKPLAGLAVVEPLRNLPCLWYRYKIERRRGDKWVTESSGESTASFLIDDGSGKCQVFPEGAEVLAADTETWHEGDKRHTLAVIGSGENIYVLGGFRTTGGDRLQLDLRGDVSELLGEWKKDPAMLHKRFDLDGNGALDLQEWELARAQARREITKQHGEWRAMPDCHSICRTNDGRPFIISSLPPEKIEKRYQSWAIGHVAVFITALAGLGYAWQLG